MKKIVKISLIIVGVSFLQLPFVVAWISIDNLLKRNRLDFCYSKYRGDKKTPPEGAIERIDNDSYSKSMLLEKTKQCELFPDELGDGEAYFLFFFDPLYESRNYRRMQVFLEWRMPPDLFSSETKRMGEIIGFYGGGPVWSDYLFENRSCIAEYNFYSGFEYALLDEVSSTIRYICFFDVEAVENLLFSTQYAPTRLLKDSDIRERVTCSGEFSIYAYYNGAS